MLGKEEKNNRLKFFGRIAISLAVGFLIFLFVSIFSKGIPGFFQYYVSLDVYLDRDRLDPKGDLTAESLYSGDAQRIILESLYNELKPKGRSERKSVKKIISSAADQRIIRLVQKILK